LLKTSLEKNKLSEDILKQITSTGSTPARLYGVPKIHKDEKDPPYRPVLSMVNAYPTNLAKYLDSVLKDHIPTNNTCKDSFDFKEKLTSLSLPTQCHLVSYDVKSLFTNIPVTETINYILTIISQDDLPLPKPIMEKLLHLACTKILFSFNDQLYTQDDGMCMGSNLGPTMAAFALDMIEKQFNNTPIFYKRYVDDVFAIFRTKDEAEAFLQHINSFHSNIQFTIEHSVENKLTFLDLDIQYKNDVIYTKWHVKKTNTGIYLPKSASSPTQYKTAAIRALIYRAYKLSSSLEFFEESYKTIQHIFIGNGYHHKYIDKIRHQVLQKINTSDQNSSSEIKKLYYKLPYIAKIEIQTKNTFKKINNLLNEKARISLAYQTNKTSRFFANKDKIVKEVRSNIVYQYICSRCGGCYTGETTRHLHTRIHEHLSGSPTVTEVSNHEHRPNKGEFSIALHTKHTKIGEALIYQEVPLDKRLNANRPGYNLKLFCTRI